MKLRSLEYRAYFNQLVRKFFDEQAFLELETPMLIQSNTPDPNIDPIFTTSICSGSGQLHTSPEIWLKRALAMGLPQVYQLARVFRDDRPSASHAREFSMLEWYRTEARLKDLITDCEAIFRLAHNAARLKLGQYHEPQAFLYYDLDTLFHELADIDLSSVLSVTSNGHPNFLLEILIKRGEHLPADANFNEAFFHVMLKYIEPQLPHNCPTVLSRWPIQLAALAEACVDNPLYCERFEIYFKGLEIANAYQECRDPEVLIRRFEAENVERKRLDKPVFSLDYHLINALVGLPEIAGIALGVDRLLLAESGYSHLKQIIFGYQEH